MEIETPAEQIETPDVGIETPNIEIKTPDVGIETPNFEIENPDFVIETPADQIVTATSADQFETPNVEIETPDVEIGKPAIDFDRQSAVISLISFDTEAGYKEKTGNKWKKVRATSKSQVSKLKRQVLKAVHVKSSVRAEGPGLMNCFVGDEGYFQIITRDAGQGTLSVRVQVPNAKPRIGQWKGVKRTIACRYNPVIAGEYVIKIKWEERHITGSPFIIQVRHRPEVQFGTVVKVATPAMERKSPTIEIEKPADLVETSEFVAVEASVAQIEPAIEIGEPAIEVKASANKIEEPAIKIEEPAIKIEEPASELETPDHVQTPALEIDTPANDAVRTFFFLIWQDSWARISNCTIL